MQLYDYANRLIKPPSRPETREIAAVSIRDRWSGYPSRGLTPGRLASIFYAADAGDLRSQAELFEEMEEKDPHLRSLMETRRLAVLGLEPKVEPASENAEDKRIAAAVEEWLGELKLKSLFIHLLGATGHGYAGAEPVWNTGGRPWSISRFNLIPWKNITYNNSVAPLVITEENSAGVEPAPFQLIFHRGAARSGHDTRNGILRVCAWMYMFKNYAWKDWAVFNEIFGMPLRLGKYDPSASLMDREALRAAISSLGSDAAGIISKSTEIEFVEASSRLSGTTNPYQVMIEMCNREMSKAVLGQTLTSDSAPGSGTLAGNAHENVRQDLLEADAEMLAETIREQIIRPLVGFNFGWDKAIPGFGLPIEDSPDLKLDSEVYKNLDEMGVPIPLSQIYERFAISPPKGDEPTTASIKPAQSQQPPGTAAAPGPGGRPAIDGPQAGKPALPGGKGNGKAAAMKAELPGMQGPYRFDDNGRSAPGSMPQDAALLARQQELDDLVRQASEAGAALAHEMLAPVMDLIQQGSDLVVIQGKLLALYPDLQTEAMGNLLYEARMRALMMATSEGNP